jgi:hypothetical protein
MIFELHTGKTLRETLGASATQKYQPIVAQFCGRASLSDSPSPQLTAKQQVPVSGLRNSGVRHTAVGRISVANTGTDPKRTVKHPWLKGLLEREAR